MDQAHLFKKTGTFLLVLFVIALGTNIYTAVQYEKLYIPMLSSCAAFLFLGLWMVMKARHSQPK
jgi:hypothetical protein